MNPRYRPRTGFRRDGQVKPIRSDQVRYPGVELPQSQVTEYERWREEGRSLRPARDAGLALEGRMARERRRRARARRQRMMAGAAVAAVVLVALIGWRVTSDRKAAIAVASETTTAAGGASTDGGAAPRRIGAADPSAAQLKAMEPEREPTPTFATFRSLKVRLPVDVKDLTEVGFHQASYPYAFHMKTPLPDADSAKVKKARTTNRNKSEQATGADAVLVGSVLRMWRSRPGKPDSAADVGAKPGSAVYAPVTGTVVKIKKYKLYGKHDDYEIHIRPDGIDDVDLVMIHIADLSANVGDHVVGGVTRIAAVRKLSDRVNHQLADYTKGGGDHVHLQLNNVNHPEYKGLQGAISVDGS